MPYVVKLLHPGRERVVHARSSNRDHQMDWGLSKYGHQRKFLTCEGRYIHEIGQKPVPGQIMFWGEWEPPSLYKKYSCSHSLDIGYPYYVHTPLIRKLEKGKDVLNTDPYVFGRIFYYSCCQQKRLLARHGLSENSIILFGSCLGDQFILDTVFVVDKQPAKAKDLTKTAQEAILAPFSRVCQKTDAPGCGNTDGSEMFQGKMWSDSNTTMFSFFPCQPAKHNMGFKRPAIKFLRKELNWSDTQKQGFACVELETIEVNKLWNKLAESVIDEGMFLGVHAAEPNLL